jgi:hypothetical protein
MTFFTVPIKPRGFPSTCKIGNISHHGSAACGNLHTPALNRRFEAWS